MPKVETELEMMVMPLPCDGTFYAVSNSQKLLRKDCRYLLNFYMDHYGSSSPCISVTYATISIESQHNVNKTLLGIDVLKKCLN